MRPARTKLAQPAAKAMGKASQTLLKADNVTLALSADKEGRVRANCGSWENAVVLLPGQVMQVQWVAGQVVLTRMSDGK